MAFSTRLATLMGRRGLRQQDVANALGCSQVAVSCWLLGKSRPTIEHLCALADFLRRVR